MKSVNTYKKFTRSLVLLGIIGALLVSVVVLSGCSEQLVAKDGEYSCIDCHTNRELLKASLKADPPPAKEVAESEGEG